MRTRLSACLLATTLLAFPSAICAADDDVTSPTAAPQAGSEDYKIGPNDKIGIQVSGIKELESTVTVSASGSISTPHLGRLYVAGLSSTELEQRIRQELKSRALVRDPQVSVSILEYNSQPIYVLGAVKRPGQFMMSRTMSVVDAITMAGGLDPEKAGHYLLVRRGQTAMQLPDDESSNGDEPVFRIDLRKLLDEGDIRQNLTLQAGDVVQVPARKVEMFYVLGEVQHPGAYEIKDGLQGQMLATHALSWAGGGGKTADLGDAVLIRNTDGGRQEIDLDFKRILKGKQADAEIQANDILFVPGSTFKTITTSLIAAIPATISGVVIWNTAMNQNQTPPPPAGRR